MSFVCMLLDKSIWSKHFVELAFGCRVRGDVYKHILIDDLKNLNQCLIRHIK